MLGMAYWVPTGLKNPVKRSLSMLPRYRDVIKNLTPDDFCDDLSETLSKGQLLMAWFIQHGAPLYTAHDNNIAYLKELFISRLLAHWSWVGPT